jgi:hypothetical protein
MDGGWARAAGCATGVNIARADSGSSSSISASNAASLAWIEGTHEQEDHSNRAVKQAGQLRERQGPASGLVDFACCRP